MLRLTLVGNTEVKVSLRQSRKVSIRNNRPIVTLSIINAILLPLIRRIEWLGIRFEMGIGHLFTLKLHFLKGLFLFKYLLRFMHLLLLLIVRLRWIYVKFMELLFYQPGSFLGLSLLSQKLLVNVLLVMEVLRGVLLRKRI